MQFRKALKMQLSQRWYFSKERDEKFANCNKKNPYKLHVVDLDDLKWRQQIKLNSSKIFFINRMISQTKRV